MSLDVRPRWKQKDHVTTTVVVLHSLTPVMWQMNLHHMGNSTSFHIVVSLFCYELLLFLLILLQFFFINHNKNTCLLQLWHERNDLKKSELRKTDSIKSMVLLYYSGLVKIEKIVLARR